MTDAFTLYTAIKETFLLLEAGDRRVFAEYGLTLPRFYALHHIAEKTGLSPSQLSLDMLRDKGNVSRLLQGMEKDRLVERRPHETDKRAHRLYLTPEGAELQAEVSAAHLASVERRLDLLEGRTVDQFGAVLLKLNCSLASELGAGGTPDAEEA